MVWGGRVGVHSYYANQDYDLGEKGYNTTTNGTTTTFNIDTEKNGGLEMEFHGISMPIIIFL